MLVGWTLQTHKYVEVTPSSISLSRYKWLARSFAKANLSYPILHVLVPLFLPLASTPPPQRACATHRTIAQIFRPGWPRRAAWSRFFSLPVRAGWKFTYISSAHPLVSIRMPVPYFASSRRTALRAWGAHVRWGHGNQQHTLHTCFAAPMGQIFKCWVTASFFFLLPMWDQRLLGRAPQYGYFRFVYTWVKSDPYLVD